MKEFNFVHIHKGNEVTIMTKTLCKIALSDAKQGATSFKNRLFSTCPSCLKVAQKTEQLLGI
jgi:hypothetical protein